MGDDSKGSASNAMPPFGFGLKRDSDARRRTDFKLYEAAPNIDAMPQSKNNGDALPVDLSGKPIVLDQKTTSACTGYSGAVTAFAAMVRDGHVRPFLPSPVAMYREARVLGGYLEEDGGAEIRNVWRAANKIGLPAMSNLKPSFKPTDLADPRTGLFPEQSVWRRPMSRSNLADAERRQALAYYRLNGLPDLLQAIADGFVVNVGFEVFRSFYGPNGPRFEVPDPDPARDRSLGGHAVAGYAYDKPSRRVLFRNSWSESAHEGKPDFTLSFSYLEKHSWDNWCCRAVEGAKTT